MKNVYVGHITSEALEDMLTLKYDKYVFECSYEAIPFLPYGQAPMTHLDVPDDLIDRIQKFSDSYSDSSEKPDISVLLSQYDIPDNCIKDFVDDNVENRYLPAWTKTESWKTRFLHSTVNELSDPRLQSYMELITDTAPYGEFSKLYNCQIHRPKPHRLCALKLLMDKDKLENGVVRFCNNKRIWEHFINVMYDSFNEFEIVHYPTREELIAHATEFFSPFKYWGASQSDRRIAIDPYYNTALFDIVCETHADKTMFTQKTFTPILLGKPFCILGTSNVNNDIKSLGFEPYHEFFDYSMEVTMDSVKSLKPAWHNTDRLVLNYENILSKLWDLDPSHDALLALKNQMQPKIDYNMQIAINLLFDDSIVPEHILKQNKLELDMAREQAKEHDQWKKFI